MPPVSKKKATKKKVPAKTYVAEDNYVVEQPEEVIMEEPKSNFTCFYFPKAKNSSFTWMIEGADSIHVSAVGNMLKIDSTTPEGKFAIGKMDKDPRNKKNGGGMFAEVASGGVEIGDSGSRIDQLNAMDNNSLVMMLGGDIELHRLTKGGLIAKALEIG